MFGGAALDVGIEVNPPDCAGLPQCAAVKLHCHHDNENAQLYLDMGFMLSAGVGSRPFTKAVGLADERGRFRHAYS